MSPGPEVYVHICFHVNIISKSNAAKKTMFSTNRMHMEFVERILQARTKRERLLRKYLTWFYPNQLRRRSERTVEQLRILYGAIENIDYIDHYRV